MTNCLLSLTLAFGLMSSCKNNAEIGKLQDSTAIPAATVPSMADALSGAIVAVVPSTDKANEFSVELSNGGSRDLTCRLDLTINDKPHVASQTVELPNLSKRVVSMRFIGEAAQFRFEQVNSETYRLTAYDCVQTTSGAQQKAPGSPSARVLAQGNLRDVLQTAKTQ